MSFYPMGSAFVLRVKDDPVFTSIFRVLCAKIVDKITSSILFQYAGQFEN